MHIWPRTARVALSCLLAVVTACDGSDPTGTDTPVSVETQSLAEGIEGVAYSEQLAAAGGSGEYTWTVTDGTLPAGLTLANGGAISGTPSASGAADFEVQVTDSEGQSATAELSIEVTAALAVGTNALAHAVRGESYAAQLEPIGGRAPYVWSLSAAGGLGWLTLSGEGVLSGTPEAAGATTVTVAVSDASGQQSSAALSLTVLDPLDVTTTTLPGAIQGRPFGVQLEAVGGDGEYAWSVATGTLPAGLDLTPSGVLVGTPVTAGTSAFTVRVADGGDREATESLSLTVAPAPTILTMGLPAALPGVEYSAQLQAHGGTGGYTWSVAGGALPAGLDLSAAGLISGTSTTIGTATFTVRVSDQADASHTRPLSITVAEAATLESGTSVTDLSGEAGSTRYYVLDVPAGVTQVVFSIAGGTGDADLYVRHDALPAEFNYDCRPLREGNQETCTFTSPDAGPWYVMIRGFSAFTGVTLTATHDG